MNLVPRACLYLLSGLLPLLAAEAAGVRGTPLYQQVTPDEYAAGARNFGIAVDGDGRIFAANEDGVVHFTGGGWQVLKLPGGQTARQVVPGADGRIYVGGVDRFGVLVDTPEGAYEMIDLRPAFGLDAEASRVGIVWQVLAANEGVWFRAERELLFRAYDGSRHQRIALPDEARAFFAVGDEVYGRVAGQGLVRVRDGALVPVPGGRAFADEGLSGLLPWDGGLLAVGSGGFHLVAPAGVRRLPVAADAEFATPGLLPVVALHDGSLAVGTGNGEVLRYDRQLRLVDRIPLGARVVHLAPDHEGGLWAATFNGLARVRLPSHWTRFGAGHGVRGVITAMEWHDDALWLASDAGLARLREEAGGIARAEPQPWVQLEAYALHSTPAGLLAGHRRGLLAFEGEPTPRNVIGIGGRSVYDLLPAMHHADTIYARGDSQIWLLRVNGGRWAVAAEWRFDDVSSLDELVEGGPDELWAVTRDHGLERLRIDARAGRLLQRQRIGPEHGLPPSGTPIDTVFRLDGRIHVVAGGEGFVQDGERFVAERSPPLSLVDDPARLQVIDTPLGMFAHTRRQIWWRMAGQPSWRPIRLGDQAAGFWALQVGSDGLLRVSTTGGQVLQYEPGEPDRTTLPALRVVLAGAELRFQDGQRQALPIADAEAAGVRVPAGSNLLVRYGLVTVEPGVQFRYLVEGVSSDWSDWSMIRELPMQARRPGDYRVHVQARTPSGREVAGFSFPLRVEARWYQTAIARSMAGALALLLLALAVHGWLRWRTRRYLTVQQRLEAHIAARTSELEQANRKLEELAVEDALTGVANRRALEQALHREWYRCLDLKRPLAVLMIDVDHFKEYNDTHGHLAGDAALRRVAGLLGEGVDPTRELLARYGGEEFVLLMPGEHPDRAHARAERIRKGLAAAGDGLTVSIGVAERTPAPGDSPEHLLHCADEALYRAKRNGRNRVECASA